MRVASSLDLLLYSVLFSFDGGAYVYGYKSIPEISVQKMPELNYVKKFNITYYGGDYRFYNLKVE